MFNVFMDKENSGAGLGLLAPSHDAPHTMRQVGKTFQQSSENDVVSKMRGLRMADINTLGHTPRPQAKAGGGSVFKKPGEFLKPQKPILKGVSLKQEGTTGIKPSEVKVVTSQSQVKCHRDDIEIMPTFDDTDTFDDLWPVRERPATYAAAFRDWRPALVFGEPFVDRSDLSPPDVEDHDFSRRLTPHDREPELLPLLSPEELGWCVPSLEDLCMSDDMIAE